MAIPVLLGTVMALAYLSGFHHPEPRGLRIDVVGTDGHSRVLAQSLQDTYGDAASVRTVDTEEAARAAVRDRDAVAAYVPSVTMPKLLVSTAASDTSAITVERMLSPVALRAGLPLDVEDVVPSDPVHDPSGQSVFFYLVALTVGAYSGGIAVAAAAGSRSMRMRLALGAGAAAVDALLVTVVAGPLLGALPTNAAWIGLLGFVYALAIVLFGIGLHPLLGRFTTGMMVLMFVALNFTSAGGVFQPQLQPGFFASLHSFWIGSGMQEAGRTLTYFPDAPIAGDVAKLLLWLAAGAVLVAIAAAVEYRRAVAAGSSTALPSGEGAQGGDAATDGPGRHERVADAPLDADRELELEEATVA